MWALIQVENHHYHHEAQRASNWESGPGGSLDFQSYIYNIYSLTSEHLSFDEQRKGLELCVVAVLFRRLTILVEPGHHHHHHRDNYDYIKDHMYLL